MNVIETKELTKRFKNGRGIENVSLNIKQGEIFGLLGPNGCGKTTAMKILTGLISPGSGKYRLFEKDPSADISVMSKVGCMIETPAFYPQLTVYENLKILCRLYPDLSESRIKEVIDQFELKKYMNDPVEKFSIGMKQRLGFAAAIIHKPKLLILDEPTNGLDIIARAKVRLLLHAFAKEGVTILMSSHITSEMQDICTRIAVMDKGHIVDVRNTEEIISRYGGVEDYYLQTTALEE